MKRILSLITILFSITFVSFAQQPLVKVALDSTYVIIGNPTTIHLEATISDDQEIKFPEIEKKGGIVAYDDSLQILLELGNEIPSVDTISEGNGVKTLKKDIEIFAFDSATVSIPPFEFVCNGDTILTNSLALRVIQPFDSIEVDPTKFFDIKTVIDPEFVFMDYILWIVIPVLLIVLLVSAFYGYNYYKKHRKKDNVVVQKIKVPAHITAMNALVELDKKKLWQSGHDKLFQTELTDILRQYIEERFEVNALEKTTDEILEELYELAEQQKSSLQNLKQILQLADLVKFAKYKPLADENQLSFVNAKMFIEQTKFEEKTENENPEDINIESNN